MTRSRPAISIIDTGNAEFEMNRVVVHGSNGTGGIYIRNSKVKCEDIAVIGADGNSYETDFADVSLRKCSSYSARKNGFEISNSSARLKNCASLNALLYGYKIK